MIGPFLYHSTFSIKRWWQSLGFGIQSKTDFAFLHDVLKEKLPYYAYEELQKQFPNASHQSLQRSQLYFRIANSVKPSEIKTLGNVSSIDSAHLHAAPKGNNGTLLFVGDKATVPHLHGYSAIIITNINNSNSHIWQQVITSNAITYDIKTIGIALFYSNRTPEHYKI